MKFISLAAVISAAAIIPAYAAPAEAVEDVSAQVESLVERDSHTAFICTKPSVKVNV